MRSDRPPQTPAEAIACGWTWIGLACTMCRHSGSLRFEDFRISQANQPLGCLLRKATCSCCGGREFNLKLGVYRDVSGQPFAHYLPIEIDGEAIIAARRN